MSPTAAASSGGAAAWSLSLSSVMVMCKPCSLHNA